MNFLETNEYGDKGKKERKSSRSWPQKTQRYKLPVNEQNHLEDLALLHNNSEQQEGGNVELETPLACQLCMSTSTLCKTSQGLH